MVTQMRAPLSRLSRVFGKLFDYRLNSPRCPGFYIRCNGSCGSPGKAQMTLIGIQTLLLCTVSPAILGTCYADIITQVRAGGIREFYW